MVLMQSLHFTAYRRSYFFEILNIKLKFFPKELIIILMLSVLIFSYFNARKRAKAFAGDVGSVSMAFLLVWMLISLILKTGNIEYILFFFNIHS
jgi:UDP-GlcNAc:undecaprenyl-phosphate GlcNAc-1-phosphate transferase